jgi:hypothetical protein
MKTTNKANLIVLTAILALFAAPALSAATSGTLVLQGSVPGILEITVNAVAGASALDLSANAADVLVASVVERSNKKAGYTVSLESANAVAAAGSSATFKSTDPTNADTLAYTISYGAAPVSLVAGLALVSDVSTKTAGTGTSREVRISYSGAGSFLFEGSYRDTLTFTITAK